MLEKGIRGGICEASHSYVKANNKYMNNYDEKINSSYIANLDANNLYGREMSQKLPVNGLMGERRSIIKIWWDFIKNYGENSDKGYFLEADIKYPKHLFNYYKDLPFLAERKK